MFVLYDVAEEIRIDKLRDLVGAETARPQPSFKHPAPEYVRFERPPAIEYPAPLALDTGEHFEARIKYFDYGVASVELKMEFEADWEQLIRLSNRWILAPEIERRTSELIQHADGAGGAGSGSSLSGAPERRLLHHSSARGAGMTTAGTLTAPVMLAKHGAQIAQIVAGTRSRWPRVSATKSLQSSLSYYPSDLLVTGWVAALVYDTTEAPSRPSNCSNTRIRSCWSSAIMTTCSRAFWRTSIKLWSIAVDSSGAGGWRARPSG